MPKEDLADCDIPCMTAHDGYANDYAQAIELLKRNQAEKYHLDRTVVFRCGLMVMHGEDDIGVG